MYHRDVYPTSSWSSSYDDLRLSHYRPPDSYWIDRIQLLLYESWKAVRYGTSSLCHAEFVDLIPDIRDVVRLGVREEATLKRIYSTLIDNDYVPTDPDHVREIIQCNWCSRRSRSRLT